MEINLKGKIIMCGLSLFLCGKKGQSLSKTLKKGFNVLNKYLFFKNPRTDNAFKDDLISCNKTRTVSRRTLLTLGFLLIAC